MTRKPTGLSAFSAPPDPPAPAKPKRAARGTADLVMISVRVTRDDWRRLRALADSENISLQAMAVKNLSRALTDKGLPGLDAADA